jgi:hypothetical protein
MGLSRILDVGISIIRRRWAVLLGVAVLFVGPGALLTAATNLRFVETSRDILGPELELLEANATITNAQLERLGGDLLAYLAATTIAGLLAAVGGLAFSAVVGADFFHRPLGLGEALGVAFRRALSALAFILLTIVIVVLIVIGAMALMIAVLAVSGGGNLDQGGPGVFLVILLGVALALALVYLTVRWAPALPAIAIEDLGWRDAFRRAWHLSGDNLWRIGVVILISLIVMSLLGALVAQLLAVVLVGVVATAVGLDLLLAESIALALGTVLVAPLLPVLTAVLYFDLRVRRDPPGSLTE